MQNKMISRQMFEVVWNQGNVAFLSQLLSPQYVLHDPANPHVRSVRELAEMILAYRRAFPDLQFVVEGQIAERNLVTTWWGAQGTHHGPFLGVMPTNKSVVVTGVAIDRFVDQRIVESRVNWDALGLFQQLGMAPEIHPALTHLFGQLTPMLGNEVGIR